MQYYISSAPFAHVKLYGTIFTQILNHVPYPGTYCHSSMAVTVLEAKQRLCA